MADCSKCKNADRCEAWDIDKVRRTGECEVYEPITNADKIRAMSDEELAGLTITYNDYYGEYYCSDGERYDSHEDAIKHEIEYLQSEAE